MKVVNPSLLAEFRSPGHCELCGFRFARRDPHHVFCKGMGGGNRLDIRVNLVGVCRECHDLAQGGKIPRDKVLAVIAERERTTVSAIREEVYRLLRASTPAAEKAPRPRKARPKLGAAKDVLKSLLRELKDGPCAALAESVEVALKHLGGSQ